MNIEQANNTFPIGTKVKYYPLVSNKENFTEHEVQSEPWELGHGDIVMKVSDKSGGVCIEHLEAI